MALKGHASMLIHSESSHHYLVLDKRGGFIYSGNDFFEAINAFLSNGRGHLQIYQPVNSENPGWNEPILINEYTR